MSEQQDNSQLSLEFPFAYGLPEVTADFRTLPEDFIVSEDLGFEPEGEGEHLLVHIRKRGENTAWVAEQLADFFGIKTMDVGYCGMKDRHALTSQWFSLYLPKVPYKEDGTKLTEFFADCKANIVLLSHCRHRKKLRRGEHHGNNFKIRLRNLTADPKLLQQRLEGIRDSGVPNYFGEQRFGRGGSNLIWASRWFDDGEVIRNRNKKVMAKSAARAYLFNSVLAARVLAGSWDQLIDNDPESAAGPLWGRGRPKVCESLAGYESSILCDRQAWLDGLEHVGLQQERRSLLLKPVELQWQTEASDITLMFTLPPGTFATSVLRELVTLKNQSNQPEIVDTQSA